MFMGTSHCGLWPENTRTRRKKMFCVKFRAMFEFSLQSNVEKWNKKPVKRQWNVFVSAKAKNEAYLTRLDCVFRADIVFTHSSWKMRKTFRNRTNLTSLRRKLEKSAVWPEN